VPELVSLELISLAEWLVSFAWAARRFEVVVRLLGPSWLAAGQLGVAAEMRSQGSFCVLVRCPLWKSMPFKSCESKRSPCRSAAGSGASGPHTEGKGKEDEEGGEREGWPQILR